MENSTAFQVITVIIGLIICGTYPLFGAYLKSKEKKFDILFEKTDEIEKILPAIKKDIDYMKEEINRLRDKQGE